MVLKGLRIRVSWCGGLQKWNVVCSILGHLRNGAVDDCWNIQDLDDAALDDRGAQDSVTALRGVQFDDVLHDVGDAAHDQSDASALGGVDDDMESFPFIHGVGKADGMGDAYQRHDGFAVLNHLHGAGGFHLRLVELFESADQVEGAGPGVRIR